MIIWRGWGFLVAVIVFGASLAAELITERLTGDDQFYQVQRWPLALALVVAAVTTWALGSYLRGRAARVVIDKLNGRESTIGGDHRFFFVPMHYWGPLLLGLAFLSFVLR